MRSLILAMLFLNAGQDTTSGVVVVRRLETATATVINKAALKPHPHSDDDVLGTRGAVSK